MSGGIREVPDFVSEMSERCWMVSEVSDGVREASDGCPMVS